MGVCAQSAGYAAAADRGVSAVERDEGSARQAWRGGRALTLADFAHSITLMDSISRVENDLAETLRAMAAQDQGEVAARRLRLAEDAAKGAQAAAKKSERLREQARHWAEHAGRVQLHQALDRAAAVLVDLDRVESNLADTLTDLAGCSDPDLAVRWQQAAGEACDAARQARGRAHVLRELAQTDGSGTQPEAMTAADVADDPALPAPARHRRLADIDCRLTELRHARSAPSGRDAAQAVAEAKRRAREADRLLLASAAHLQQTRQFADNALRRAATAHDHVAKANESSARAGIGDVAEYKRIAAVHRAAAEADRRRARESQGQVADPQPSA